MTSQQVEDVKSGESCEIVDAAEIVDIFTNIKIIICGFLVSTILTLPALSIYFRNTEQNPSRSYMYSCALKFISSFFASSAIVGGIFVYECWNGVTLTFCAAVLVEAVEFIFDFGRLMLFFGDPGGELDVYQNVRWNSTGLSGSGFFQRFFKLFLIGIPVFILLVTMWMFVLFANFSQIIQSYIEPILTSDDFELYHAWWIAIGIYGVLFFTCMGGYHLIRLCCTYQERYQDTGPEFFWSQFKAVAVDIPSFLATVLNSGVNSLVLFWTLEFINDFFPFIAPMIPEICSIQGENTDEEEQNNDGKNDEIEDVETGLESTGDMKTTSCTTTVHIPLVHSTKDVIHMEELQRHPLYSNCEERSKARLHKAMTTKKLRLVGYRIDRKFPVSLIDKMTEAQWERLCDKIDGTLEIADTSTGYSYNRCKCCMKTGFIFLGLLASGLFWIIWYYNLRGITERKFWLLFVVIFGITGWTCFKACFKINRLPTEIEIIQMTEDVCNSETADDIDFHFRMEKLFKFENAMRWCCRGGFSCAQGIQCIRYIECNVTSNMVDQDSTIEMFVEDVPGVTVEYKIKSIVVPNPTSPRSEYGFYKETFLALGFAFSG